MVRSPLVSQRAPSEGSRWTRVVGDITGYPQVSATRFMSPPNCSVGSAWRVIFMSSSAAIVDSPLQQAGMRLSVMPAGGLAPRGVNVLFQVRLRLSGLRPPVSLGDSAISRRTVMSNAR